MGSSGDSLNCLNEGCSVSATTRSPRDEVQTRKPNLGWDACEGCPGQCGELGRLEAFCPAPQIETIAAGDSIQPLKYGLPNKGHTFLWKANLRLAIRALKTPEVDIWLGG